MKGKKIMDAICIIQLMTDGHTAYERMDKVREYLINKYPIFNVNVLNEYLPDNPAGGDYKVSFRANDFQMFETLVDLSGVYIDVNALILSIRLKKTLYEGDFDLMEYLNSLNDPDLIEMFDILNLKLK